MGHKSPLSTKIPRDSATKVETALPQGRMVISLAEVAAILRKRNLEKPILFLFNEAMSGDSAANLEEGIVLLEAATVRALSVSILWSRRLPRPASDSYWRKAFLVATIARHWAFLDGRVDAEKAFLSGLLQQIGKLRQPLHTSRSRDFVEEGLRIARRFAFAPWVVEVISTAHANHFGGPNRELAMTVDLARCCAEWLSVNTNSAEIPSWIFNRYADTEVLIPKLRDLREPRDEAIRIWARFPPRR